jgi:hypothetical protein
VSAELAHWTPDERKITGEAVVGQAIIVEKRKAQITGLVNVERLSGAI